MASSRENLILVPVRTLRPGAYIVIKDKWAAHPFLFNQFRIKDGRKIDILLRCGITEVYFDQERSNYAWTKPAEAEGGTGEAPAAEPVDPASLDRMWREKERLVEKQRRKKDEFRQVEKELAEALETVRDINRGVSGGSAEVHDRVNAFARTICQRFFIKKDTLVKLISSPQRDLGVQSHSLNVFVLSLLFGAALKLSPQELGRLGHGALLHDVGKLFIERKIVRKAKLTDRIEIREYRRHPEMGLKALTKCGGFAKEVLSIVYHHHENADGSGYPAGLSLHDTDLLTRIVRIADTYDRLINPLDPAQVLTPHQALTHMYGRMKNILDANILSTAIRALGLYPPGTVVELSSHQLGVVIEVNPKDLSRPVVMIYDEYSPAEDAPVIDLLDAPDMSVIKCLHPSRLSREAYTYLNPGGQLSYFPWTEGEILPDV